MGKSRGFRIRHKLLTIFKRAKFHRRRISGKYKKLKPPSPSSSSSSSSSSSNCTSKAISRLCKFGRCLRKGAKELCFSRPGQGYKRVGEDPVGEKPPKGHLAVYVGEKEDESHRVLVPVIYFNHPLFGELLREAEKVYGFNHRGGIHVPCRISEFEHVQTRINDAAAGAAGCGGIRSCRARRGWW